ncbi:IS3 family transposase [Streptomyces sp. WC2508]|uniref:IS3 family transposase n=1 Tax=Streptomyces sp. WC2508 TaxID=3461405 RepID=UPI004043AC09
MAAAESFWAVLKEEIVTRFRPDRATARAGISDFIETFYNRRRLRKHVHWGHLTPRDTPAPPAGSGPRGVSATGPRSRGTSPRCWSGSATGSEGAGKWSVPSPNASRTPHPGRLNPQGAGHQRRLRTPDPTHEDDQP